MFFKPGRRHLAGSKNRKRMRRLGKVAVLAETDVARITENLPFR
jgi:large subunit ribosomal protein L35